MTTQEALQLALQHQHAGQLRQAEELYRQVLAVQPDHADALHLMGVLAAQVANYEAAWNLLSRALALNPANAECQLNFGVVLEKLGRREEAVSAYRQALALKPNYPKALSNLGNVFWNMGRAQEAIVVCRRAIALEPDYADAHYNLGCALLKDRQIDQAIVSLEKSVRLRPDHVEAHNNLGTARQEAQQWDQAIASFRLALALRPDSPEILSNLGNSLRDKAMAEGSPSDLDQAVSICRRAIAMRPDFPEGIYNLGNALLNKGAHDEAITCFRKALALRPDYVEACNNIGNAQHDQGDLASAMDSFRAALAIRPNHPEAHLNLGLAYLTLGDFERGWEEYEWRWGSPEFTRLHAKAPGPAWDGTDLCGRRILLHSEQGIGDTIQMVRFIPRIARSGRITLACQPELLRLLQNYQGIEQLAPRHPPPDFDVQSPLLSLPRLLKVRLATIPADIPYLRANQSLKRHWQTRMPNDGRIKVGLVWAGRRAHSNDRNRSMPLAKLNPLAQQPGVWLCSLQKGEAARQTRFWPGELTDWTEELKDLADTAALIDNLDLIITVDTAVTHLAGAMGKAVWVLLPFMPDWRWMLGRSDSPWYPTVRLFRQPKIGDWETPIGQIVKEMRGLKTED